MIRSRIQRDECLYIYISIDNDGDAVHGGARAHASAHNFPIAMSKIANERIKKHNTNNPGESCEMCNERKHEQTCDSNTSEWASGWAGRRCSHAHTHALWKFHSRAARVSKRTSERMRKRKNEISRGRLNCICRSKNAFNLCFYSFNLCNASYNVDRVQPTSICVCACALRSFILLFPPN